MTGLGGVSSPRELVDWMEAESASRKAWSEGGAAVGMTADLTDVAGCGWWWVWSGR